MPIFKHVLPLPDECGISVDSPGLPIEIHPEPLCVNPEGGTWELVEE